MKILAGQIYIEIGKLNGHKVMSGVLALEQVYDAAELEYNSVPVGEIKYAAFADEAIKDWSLLTSLTNLRVLALRVCGFVKFPVEIFELQNLEHLDLTGNSFSAFDQCDQFSKLPKLRALNMRENSLNDISEALKLSSFENLKQLTLTGNVCMSAHDAFNRIIKVFPNLIVLNEYIVTSQHRAYLEKLTVYDTRATVPLSHADDYIFYYVKYMHGCPAQRHIRRINALFFCVNRVMRHKCVVTKIQCVFRGWVARKQYAEMKKAAIVIEKFVRVWYLKRKRAAMKIKGAFLHHLLRQKIKRIVSARAIQNFWRRYLDRRATLTRVFENHEGSCDVYLTQECLVNLRELCAGKGFAFPDNARETQYRVLRIGTPKKRPLLGSPIVYYNVEENVLVRKASEPHQTNASIWCGHVHSKAVQEEHVSKSGVNFAENCPFSTIRFVPYQRPIRRRATAHQYPRLMMIHFERPKELTTILEHLVLTKQPGILLFSESSLKHAAAQLTIHSALRSFVVRRKYFKQLKREALELRAKNAIKYAVRTKSIMSNMKHITDVANWYRNAPDTHTYFVTSDFLKNIANTRVLYPVKFGYTSDKKLSLASEEAESGCILWALFPATKPIFYQNSELSSLVKVEVTMSKAMSSMLQKPLPNKWLRRAGIVRLAFQTQEEAAKRIASFCFATGDFSKFMTEQDLRELCCSQAIKNCWVGYSMRSTMQHEAAQKGVKLNLGSLLKRQSVKQKTPGQPAASVASMQSDVKKIIEKDGSIAQAIHDLRGDYMPWTQFEKIRRPYIAPEWKQVKEGDEEREITQSMKAMGVAHELDGEFQTIRLGEGSEQREMKQPPQNPRAISVLLPKPTYHDDHKPVSVVIQSETEKIFGRPLSDIKADFSSTSSTTFEERLRSMPEPESIGPMARPRTAVNYWPGGRTIQKETSEEINENSSSQEHVEPVKDLRRNWQGKRPKTAQNVMKPESRLTPSLYPQKTHRNAQAKQGRPVTPRVQFKKDAEKQQAPQPLIAMAKEKPRDPSGIVKVESKTQNWNAKQEPEQPKRARSQFNDRILGDLKPKLERTAKSPQGTNEILKEAIREAFTKLARLRQIGIDIEKSFVVDNTLQQKRASTVHAQERQKQSRLEMLRTREEAASDARERNAIERQELKEKAMEVKAKVQHLREVAARRAKTSHAKRVNKYKQEKAFAQHFVSVSRQVAQVVETRHRKMEERKIFAGVQARADNARKESREMREKHKNTIREMTESKLEAARHDRKLLDEKRDVLKQRIQQRLEQVIELKHQLKETMAQVAELRRTPQYIHPNNQPTLETDEFGGAVFCIGQYVGANMGDLEKQLICSLISEALGPQEQYCL